MNNRSFGLSALIAGVDHKYKRAWRVTELVCFALAMLGPWAYDRIVVPSEYTCSAPVVRLENDYCGLPLAGVTILRFMAVVTINIAVELVMGTTNLTTRGGELLVGLSALVLLLPLVSILLLIWRGDSRRLRILHDLAWALAGGGCLLIFVSGMVLPPGQLWGIWLYIGLAAIALVLDGMMWVVGKKTGSVTVPR